MDDTIREKLFDFTYEMAYRDATMRKAFPKGGDSDEAFRERKENSKVAAKQIVNKYINTIFDENSSRSNTIDTIVDVCKVTTKYGFTFGNAQKLVNMTAKYMYLSIYGTEGVERDKYREKFRYCHCPMDGVMIKNLADSLEKMHPEIDWNKVAWSKQTLDNHEAYDAYQDSVNRLADMEKCNALEIDFYYYY